MKIFSEFCLFDVTFDRVFTLSLIETRITLSLKAKAMTKYSEWTKKEMVEQLEGRGYRKVKSLSRTRLLAILLADDEGQIIHECCGSL